MSRVVQLACVILLTQIFLIQGVAFAAPEPKLCSIIRLKTLRQYVLRKEVKCFTTARQAERRGYLLLDESLRRKAGFKKSAVCGFLGLKKTGRYLPRRFTSCIRSIRSAAKSGLQHYPVKDQVTPSPTTIPTTGPTQSPGNSPTPGPTQIPQVTPTPGPTDMPQATPTSTPIAVEPTPTATPLPSNYTVALIEDDGSAQQGTPEGSCTGTLNDNVMTLDCTHTNEATTAHIHFAPDNTEFCGVDNPPENFQIVCPLTADQLDSLAAGKMFLAVEGGPIEANGYVVPAS